MARPKRAGLAAGGFGRWWLDGLLLWLPGGLRERLRPRPTRLVIEPVGDEVVLAEEKAGRGRELRRHLAQLEQTAGASSPSSRPRPANSFGTRKAGPETSGN